MMQRVGCCYASSWRRVMMQRVGCCYASSWRRVMMQRVGCCCYASSLRRVMIRYDVALHTHTHTDRGECVVRYGACTGCLESGSKHTVLVYDTCAARQRRHLLLRAAVPWLHRDNCPLRACECRCPWVWVCVCRCPWVWVCVCRCPWVE